MIVVLITKRIGIIRSIQVCLISQVNISYKENGGEKNSSCKSRTPTSCIPMGEHDCSANNKKNGDSYEYPSLTYFIEEH